MATLGSTGKAEAQQFDRKRKLFLVPLVTIPPQLEEQISDCLLYTSDAADE